MFFHSLSINDRKNRPRDSYMWWYPRRAVIMGEDGYERYDFFDESKFDMAMWDIVTGDYDQLEYSDSFELISSETFQDIWNKTKKEHEPEPW